MKRKVFLNSFHVEQEITTLPDSCPLLPNPHILTKKTTSIVNVQKCRARK